MLRNNLMLPTEALDIPEAIDFDGTNDYLSRSSDLVGNTDGKTFTFSAWVWWDGTTTNIVYCAGSSSFYLQLESGNILYVFGKNSSGTFILDLSVANALTKNTFNHIVLSVSLVSTASRYIYVNDLLPSSVSWNVYTNDTVDFTQASHKIGAFGDNNYKLKGRLSHVYLDYTYRDLSVEANRRLFITADRKPAANQASLNPILYLKMDDPTAPGKNLGTGGDFNLTGVVARSGRGPNQFNAPYSDLDGTADYLSKTGALGNDSQQVTINFTLNTRSLSATQIIMGSGSATYGGYEAGIRVRITTSGRLSFLFANATNTSQAPKMYCTLADSLVIGRNYTVTLSFDLTDTGKRWVFVNGIDKTSTTTWSIYNSSGTINFSYSLFTYLIGKGDSYFNGRLGAFWFNTSYIDLSQPANLAKFVTGTGIDAKPVDLGANGELPFGTAPLIYLPMYGNNAGKNYGTGGDFTVNSGPFPGARGPNEYWGNWASFEGGYLSRTSQLVGVSDGKTICCTFRVKTPSDVSTLQVLFYPSVTGANTPGGLYCYILGGNLVFGAYNISGVQVVGISHGVTANTVYDVQISFDLTSTSKRNLYVNGTLSGGTWGPYANDVMNTATQYFGIGAVPDAKFPLLSAKLSEFYFTTDYIDFSQEANRLKFRDAFGNPVALQPQIEAGTLPNPAIYMRFDPANFGKNSGTGGDFTVNGTITDGGQL